MNKKFILFCMSLFAINCLLFSKTDIKNVEVIIGPNYAGITNENGDKIKLSIKALWGEMWDDYENSKSKVPKVLPDCIYLITDEYKKYIEDNNLKVSIKWTDESGTDSDFEHFLRNFNDGNVGGAGELVKYDSTTEFWLKNVWQKWYWTWEDYKKWMNEDQSKSPELYCTKAILFHEMLHLAFNYAPLLHTEAKVEDCETRLYKTCTNRPYEEQNKNPVGDDCNCINSGTLGGQRIIGSPGGDACDDNVSFSSGNTTQNSIDSKSLIYMNGYFEEANALFGGNYFEGSNSAEQLFSVSPILIFPSGGLFSQENNSTLKTVLEEYVRLGGTVIVFSQQYGAHIDNVVPIPQGESLKSYGWREDNSCWANAINLKAMHPALAAMAAGSLPTDGQFSIYPSDSTILLRKSSNQEPVLLYYPYGSGTVILTSMYTDWGAAHSQATASELRLVRDLITFAKNPNLSIPMYDLTANPTPAISLQVKVKNDSEYAASKTKLTVYTPDRKTVLYQTESAVSLATGEEIELPLSFTLPELTDVNLGICHTDYELYDSESNLVQMTTEADSGRFTPYRLKLTQTPVKDLVCWLTAKSEFVFWDENPQFVLHLRNNTDHDMTESFTYEWWHGNRTPLTTLTVGPGQLLDYEFEVPLLTNIHNWSNAMESFFVHKTSNWSWQTHKGIRVVYPSFSSLSVHTPTSGIRLGAPINFTINSTNTTGKAIPGEMTVKLLNMNYNGIETLYSQTYAFGKDETFSYSGSQALANPLPPGRYYLRFGIKRPDGAIHYSYVPFSYVRSIVSIKNLATIPEAYKISNYDTRLGLIPGQAYSVNFILKNSSFFAINQGRYIVTIKSESGIEVFRKEVTNIAFNAAQELAFSESFDFSPVASGKYILQVEYSDESRTAELVTVCKRQYEYLMNAVMTTDKTNYHYLETVNIQLKIAGIGGFHLKVACVKAGFSEERDITVPTGEFQAIEAFQMPVGFPVFNDYKIEYEITDLTGSKLKGYLDFQVASIKMKMSGNFSAITAKVGEPLNLHLDVQGVSGFVVPLGGELLVQAPGLAFSETRPVTIEPTGSNSFNFSIPVAGTVAAGQYGIDTAIIVAGKSIYSVTYPIQIPEPGMRLSEPPSTIAAGAALPLDFVNDGGKDGNYTLELNLKDGRGMVMLTQSATQTIAAGGAYHFDLPIADGLKSGKYILKQAVTETLSGKNFGLQSEFTISGLTATLNAYTLKEKYFDNETVAGKADIVAGGNIASGTLKAKISKTKWGVSRFTSRVHMRVIEKLRFLTENLLEAKHIW